MSTKEPRVNVALDSETLAILKMISEKTNKSVSSICAEFIRKQIEWDEDAYDVQYIKELGDPSTWVTYSEAEVKRMLDALPD